MRNNTFRGNDRRDDRREDRQMHRATCADCGKSCEVPFRPSGGKPVYCSDCFGRGDSSGSSSGSGSGLRKPDKSNKKHDEINAKLDKILFLLQRADPIKEMTVMKPKKKDEAPKKTTKNTAKKVVAKKKPAKAAPKKTAKKVVAVKKKSK